MLVGGLDRESGMFDGRRRCRFRLIDGWPRRLAGGWHRWEIRLTDSRHRRRIHVTSGRMRCEIPMVNGRSNRSFRMTGGWVISFADVVQIGEDQADDVPAHSGGAAAASSLFEAAGRQCGGHAVVVGGVDCRFAVLGDCRG
ncbi:hypothetical protein ACQP2Y_03255 [Actinoplanes sp. CA-051413]|uniref:hypothetical protein n=1 Tax=Actinoplanes sp. CA-051413 TaxID=3239899 RepID=UPI003D9664D7